MAVEGQLASSAAPMFALRAAGRAPAGKTAVRSHPLRWASDLLRFDAAIERSGPTRTTGRVNAEAVATLALGPARAPSRYDVGAMFEGPHILLTVSLHFDVSRGLRAEFATQR